MLISLKSVILFSCVVVWALSTPDNENVLFKKIWKKITIYMRAITFMILSKDSKGIGIKYNPDPANIKSKMVLGTKTIVFIRHGESDWNNIFNKGINVMMLINFFKSWVIEMRLFWKPDSVFIDSPLNIEGVEQAAELNKFIKDESQVSLASMTNSSNVYKFSDTSNETPSGMASIITILSGENKLRTSVIVSSCLRRAIATTTVGLWYRLSKTNEQIYVLSSLQEISRNVDTYALSDGKGLVADLPFSRITPHCGNTTDHHLQSIYNTTDFHGNKSTNFSGIKRLKSFLEWIFLRDEDTIIVGGHSLWFKYFFQTFLPFNSNHVAKTSKIANSGVVSFVLSYYKEDDGTKVYKIDPDSINVIYGGFTKK
eukprot:gene11539-15457_t